jgi:GNAT superfamily N-acetyltransferase
VENPASPIGAIAVRTPPGVELRPFGRDDLQTVVAMTRELHGAGPVTNLTSLRPRLEALVGSADFTPLLAIDGAEAVGLGVLHFRRRLNFATFEGWISELFVRADARRRGIGRALLDGLVAEWRLRGSHRLQAKVPNGADGAAGLMAAAGLEEWMLDFRLRPVVARTAVPLPDGLVIRLLTADDGEAVTKLISEFGPARTPAPDRMDAVLRAFAEHATRVTNGGAASVVAELAGDVVGVCTLEWQQPFWTDETDAWLPDLVVAERARRRGIGRALVAHAVERAGSAGASQLSLETGQHRTPSHVLYRSMGFEETGRTYLLRRAEAK